MHTSFFSTPLHSLSSGLKIHINALYRTVFSILSLINVLLCHLCDQTWQHLERRLMTTENWILYQFITVTYVRFPLYVSHCLIGEGKVSWFSVSVSFLSSPAAGQWGLLNCEQSHSFSGNSCKAYCIHNVRNKSCKNITNPPCYGCQYSNSQFAIYDDTRKEIDCLQYKALWTKPVHKILNFILLMRWRENNLILNCKLRWCCTM